MSVRIINADVRDGLRQMKAEGVRAQTCVTSPPYWGLRDYGVAGQIGLERTPDEFVATMVDVFRLVRDVLADDGTLWLNLGDSYAAGRGGTAMPAETLAGGVGGLGPEKAYRGRPAAQVPNTKNPNAPIAKYQPHRDAAAIGLKHKDLIGIPWRVAFALQADGWYLRSDIIWHKPNPMPESVTDRPTKAHEYLFLLSKRERYYYDAAAIAESAIYPGDNRAERRDTRKEVDPMCRDGGSRARTGNATGETRNRRTVWTVATQPYSGAHFATFPPALIEPCILAGSRPSDWVLDPFMGAGTTALVADQLQRNAIGCELNPQYVDLARRRVERACPLFAEVTA